MESSHVSPRKPFDRTVDLAQVLCCNVTFALGQETIQVINIWKASTAFASVVLSEKLGALVSQVSGCVRVTVSCTQVANNSVTVHDMLAFRWEHGCRLAQDQVWAKPPGAG